MNEHGNTVQVGACRNLEVGDIFAREFLGNIISGEVKGIAHIRGDLTPEQLEYMKEHKLTIPTSEYESVGGPMSCLIFFDSEGNTKEPFLYPEQKHMFVDYNEMFAVFPNARRDRREIREAYSKATDATSEYRETVMAKHEEQS